MPKITRSFLAFLIVLSLPISACATTTLTYSDHEPLGNMRTRFLKEVFFTAVETESQGRLHIDARWGGERAASNQALSAVSTDQITDMATVVPEYAAENLPLYQIFKSFPLGPNTGDQQLAFFRRVFADIPDFTAELEKNNVVKLFTGLGYPVAFFSTHPLNSPDDLTGNKWRTASFWHQRYLQNAGATVVRTPWGDATAAALRNGTLDGLMVNIDSGDDIQAEQIAPHILTAPDLWLGHVYLLVINKNVWEKLSKADQQALQRAATIAYQTAGKVLDAEYQSMLGKMQKSGASIKMLDDNALASWQNTTHYQQAQAEWVAEQEAKGVTNANTVLQGVTTIMNETIKRKPQ